MASLKTLQGVAHNLCHHAQSGLSWLHPHLGRACRAAGVSTAGLDFLDERPYPPGLPPSEPLGKALSSLGCRFWEMVEHQGLSRESVQSVRLEFTFRDLSSDYDCSVSAWVTSSRGRVYHRHLR